MPRTPSVTPVVVVVELELYPAPVAPVAPERAPEDVVPSYVWFLRSSDPVLRPERTESSR